MMMMTKSAKTAERTPSPHTPTRNLSADEIGERYRLNHATVVQAACQAKQLSAERYACKPLASCLLTEHT